jgi:hypothetical protein
VFVQLFPQSRALSALRRELSALGLPSPDETLRARVRRRLVAGLAGANLVRFSGPVTRAFIRETARRRWTGFGSWTITHLEVVRTDKLLSETGTRTIDCIALGRPGDGEDQRGGGTYA